MPFKSQAQRRFFYAAASRGDIPEETVKHWEEATPKGKKLPEHVKKAAFGPDVRQLAQGTAGALGSSGPASTVLGKDLGRVPVNPSVSPAGEIIKTAFFRGFEKKANLGEHLYHGAELAGLGILAAPSVAALRGKPWKEKNKDIAEVAGLGILAAPSAIHLGKSLLRRGK